MGSYTCGLRGCAGQTKRRGKLRYCAQKAIVWDRKGVGWCFYHNPANLHAFGERAKPTPLKTAKKGYPMKIDYDRAVTEIVDNADRYRDRKPTLRTLLSELAELAYALDGDHEHPPEYELIEIGGIAINMLRQRYAQQED